MIGAIIVSGIAREEIVSLTLAPAELIAMVVLLWQGPGASTRSAGARTGAVARAASRRHSRPMDPERRRLQEVPKGRSPWRRWGPYLSERAWGTVREDYSARRRRLGLLPARPRPLARYRWNEDGLAGICDDRQTLCFALAFWNGRDPILKERIFGLTGNEGNHGEDAKEYWFYLDSTPTHSWMRWRYMYPQARVSRTPA